MFTDKKTIRKLNNLFYGCFNDNTTILEMVNNIVNNKELNELIDDCTEELKFTIVYVWEPNDSTPYWAYDEEYSIQQATTEEFLKFLNDYDTVADWELGDCKHYFNDSTLDFSCFILRKAF